MPDAEMNTGDFVALDWIYRFGNLPQPNDWHVPDPAAHFRIVIEGVLRAQDTQLDASADTTPKQILAFYLMRTHDGLRECVSKLDGSVQGPTGPVMRPREPQPANDQMFVSDFVVSELVTISEQSLQLRALDLEGFWESEMSTGTPVLRHQRLLVPDHWTSDWAKAIYDVIAGLEGTNSFGFALGSELASARTKREARDGPDQEPLAFPTPPELPDVLYHYTSIEGLRNIIRSKTLWGTHVRFLNDESEWLYGFTLLKSKVETIPSGDPRSERMKAASIRMIDELVELYANSVDIFVACLCDKGDLLSQFRLYGDISIGLEVKELQRLHPMPETDYAFWPILYDNEVTSHALLIRFAEAFLMMDVQYHGAWDVSVEELRQRMKDSEAMSRFMTHMPFWAGQIKHAGFREEREWRAIRFTPSSDDDRTKYRDGPMGQTPFVEFNVTDPAAVARLPLIREIICGPPNSEERVQDVQRLLLEAGYNEAAVEVRPSDIPFRTGPS
jgi:hypothetical protein